MDIERFKKDLYHIRYIFDIHEDKFLKDLVNRNATWLYDVQIGMGESTVYYCINPDEYLEKPISTRDLLEWVNKMEQHGKETDSSSD